MKFNTEQIQKIFSENRNFQMGKSYYSHDAVSEITIHKNFNGGFRADGNVKVYDKDFPVMIEADANNNIIQYHCKCDYATNKSACGHIGAMILKINECNPISFPFYFKDVNRDERESELKRKLEIEREERKRKFKLNQTDSVIDLFKDKSINEIKNVPLSQNVRLKTEIVTQAYDGIEIRFKIGDQKLYVIKDIPAFIGRMSHGAYHEYGKEFSFIHNEKYLDEDSLRQLEFIKLMSFRNSNDDNSWRTDKNRLLIDENSLDDFFDVYENIDPSYYSFGMETVFQEIEVSVMDSQGDWLFEYHFGRSKLLGKKHMYIYSNINSPLIQRVYLDENSYSSSFLRLLREDDSFVVEEAQKYDFQKYVLDNVSETLSFDLQLEKDLVSTSVFVDVDEDGNIAIKLSYETSFGEYNAFQNMLSVPLEVEKIAKYIETYANEIDEGRGLAIFSDTDDMTYVFLDQGVPYLQGFADIYVSEAIKAITDTRSYHMSAGVRINGGLLEIDIDSDAIPKQELTDVLKSYRKKKKFHRLKNGDIINLQSDEIENVNGLLESNNLQLSELNDGSITMVHSRAFEVSRKLEDQDAIDVTFDPSVHNFIDKFQNFKEENIPLEPRYQELLRGYQRDGIQWLYNLSSLQLGGILADDMGLGKTLQVISYLDTLNPDKTSIVVCPSSVMLNWIDEIHKFAPHLNALAITGTQEDRKKLIQNIRDYKIVVTSYDFLRRDIDEYEEFEFSHAILDEAQYIKNHMTKNARTTKRLKAQHRVALTGTPIENSLSELWSIFDFIMPGYLYNHHYFVKTFEKPIIKDKDEGAHKRLRQLVEPFILRRLKKDVLTELPDKIETTLRLEFNEEEKQLYYANLAQINQELALQTGIEQASKIDVLAMLTRLRQICCEPRVLYQNMDQASTKLLACVELVKTLKSEGKKVLVFSSFTSMLDLIREELTKESVSSYVIEGKTPKPKRRELIQQFQTDDTDVFLISLKAGGTGINLTAAEAVIHFDPWWNVSSQNQATDRAHRFGQTENVSVYQLIMKDTVEEKIQKLQAEKKVLSDTFIEGASGNIASLSEAEMRSLFEM
ncbi:SNF2-related protein [Erysipelothrix inopinata]